jgi:two-component system OmpR family response regulator
VNILLVEDDPETALYVTEGLQKHGHEVHWAPTGKDGLHQAQSRVYGLLIVDRMLPGMDGMSLVRLLRNEAFDTPIMFLTTMSGLDDRVEGLNSGADDYLTKPFALSELTARVNAIVRRTSRSNVTTRLRTGSLDMDLLARSVTRDGHKIELQPQEFKLLEYLAQNANRTVTRTMLLENVWNIEFDPGTNIVESHISRLRSKIDRGFNSEMIRTVRGCGYVLCAQ